MVAEFNAANPGIVVEWISGGQGPEREAKFGAMVAAGTPQMSLPAGRKQVLATMRPAT